MCGGQLGDKRDRDPAYFYTQGGAKAAALGPVTGRKVSGDFVRLKDAQDRCTEPGPCPLAGPHMATDCLSLRPLLPGWYK